jgi:hypothetical protein
MTTFVGIKEANMEYPVKRDLDGCFFRVRREGKWYNLCWTDLTEVERTELVKEADKYWLRRMLEYITQLYRHAGDQLDLYGGELDEDL